MRTRALLTALCLSLSAGASAFGCQYIAGITVLEITGTGGHDGGGGATGSGGTSTHSSTTTTTGTGGTGGAPCSMASQCGTDSDCATFSCSSGKCSSLDADLGVLCQDDAGDHVCDGDGSCKAATCSDMVKDGHETDVDCGGGLPCKGCPVNGHCLASSDCANGYCAPSGDAGPAGLCTALTGLGGTCTVDDQCGAGHFCTEGVCCTSSSCEPYACSSDTGMCKGSPCASSSDCASDSVCAPTGMPPAPMQCQACGTSPMPPPAGTGCTVGQMGCETCQASPPVCITTCDSPNECNGGSKTVGAMEPAQLQCEGQCQNETVTCMGANPCEIVCDTPGGCSNLTINCSSNGGNCTLTCLGGCGANIVMNCGDNQCVANCDGQPNAVITQNPKKSCGASKAMCL